MRAAVFGPEGLAVCDDVDVRRPGAGEVSVDLLAAGVCHSDLKVITGATAYPLPVVMGHEGAGLVAEVGPGVHGVAPGDRVVLHTLRSCGTCSACADGRPTACRRSGGGIDSPFRRGDEPVHQFANTSVFVERTVVSAGQVVAIDPAIPAPVAALLGCGVITGVGAVLNRGRVRPGESVAVIGAGGVGLNAVQGASLAGARHVVAVDVNEHKRELALALGATGFVAPGADFVAEVLASVPDAFDCVVVCIGKAELVAAGVDLLAPGGRVVVVGFPGGDAQAAFTMARLYQDKSILACRYGSSSPQRDIPMLCDMYRAGRLRLDELVSRIRPLEEVAEAFDDLTRGNTVARTVLTL